MVLGSAARMYIVLLCYTFVQYLAPPACPGSYLPLQIVRKVSVLKQPNILWELGSFPVSIIHIVIIICISDLHTVFRQIVSAVWFPQKLFFFESLKCRKFQIVVAIIFSFCNENLNSFLSRLQKLFLNSFCIKDIR